MTIPALQSRALNSIVAEIVVVCVLGYFLIGREIFVVRHPSMSFLVLSLTGIGAFNVLLFRGKTEFYYLLLFVTVTLSITWFFNHSFSLTFRGLGRFWAVVVMVMAVRGILRTGWVSRIPFVGFTVWLIVGIVFYGLLVMMDLYLFSLYPPEAGGYYFDFLKNALKLGAVMGGSIGLGYEVGRLLSPISTSPDSPPPSARS